MRKGEGCYEDSQEQQDLELVRKARDPIARLSLSSEELTRATDIERTGVTEYQQRQLELDAAKSVCQEAISDYEGMIVEENAVIRGTKLERLKHAPMSEARKQADEILETAVREIIGMAIEDSKEYIDEKQEKQEEQADKLEEQRKEQEKFIESRRKKRKEEEAFLEDMPVEEMMQLAQAREDVQQEVKKILSEMKLVAEDIKGATVDESI